MGATVICDKKIAACRNKRGEIFYLAFIESYAKNDYPHQPDWSCFAFGSFEEVMKKIFQGASSCESGMMRSKNGQVKPENYIKSWSRLMTKPVRFDEGKLFTLSVGDQWRSTIPISLWTEAATALCSIGRDDIVRKLSTKGETVSVSLGRDFEVIQALYSVNGPIPVWRLLEVHDCKSFIDSSLLPQREITSTIAYTVHTQFFNAGNNRLLMKEPGKEWKSTNSPHSLLVAFIQDVAYPAEMKATGLGFRLIAEYRERIASAPELPVGTKVTVTIAPGEIAQHYVEEARRFAKMMGQWDEVFSFALDYQKLEPDQAFHLFDFHEKQLLWEIPAYLAQSINCEQNPGQEEFAF